MNQGEVVQKMRELGYPAVAYNPHYNPSPTGYVHVILGYPCCVEKRNIGTVNRKLARQGLRIHQVWDKQHLTIKEITAGA